MAQCQARKKRTDQQCQRRAVEGKTVCTVHGAGTKKRVASGERKAPGRPVVHGYYSKTFKAEVMEKIKEFQEDPDIDKLDTEIAYLKSLLGRIEDLADESMPEADKIILLEKILSSIFKNMDSREKIKESRRYSIGVDKLKQIIKYMFAAVNKHVNDQQILALIARDFRELASKADNADEQNMLM